MFTIVTWLTGVRTLRIQETSDPTYFGTIRLAPNAAEAKIVEATKSQDGAL